MIRQFSAGGVVYKKTGDKVLFLICKRSDNIPNFSWNLPKGWLDDAASDEPGPFTLGQKRATSDQVQESALREVREEGGVEAKIIQRLGTDQFFFVDHHHEKIFKTVIYFLMEYIRDLPEGFGVETSEITWADSAKACELLKSRKGELNLILKANQIVTKI